MQPTSLAVEGALCELNTKQPTEAKSGPATTESDVQLIHQLLAQQVGERSFQNWFAGKVRLTREGSFLVIGVASPFILTWMQKKFASQISATAIACIGPSAEYRFEVDPLLEGENQNDSPKPTSTPESVALPASISSEKKSAQENQNTKKNQN